MVGDRIGLHRHGVNGISSRRHACLVCQKCFGQGWWAAVSVKSTSVLLTKRHSHPENTEKQPKVPLVGGRVLDFVSFHGRHFTAKMQHRFDSNYTCGLPTPTTLRHTFGISQRGFGKFVMSAGKNHLQCPRVAATTTAARALAHLPHCP